MFFMAALTRSRDSLTELSGRPTITKAGKPFVILTSTTTSKPDIPDSPADLIIWVPATAPSFSFLSKRVAYVSYPRAAAEYQYLYNIEARAHILRISRAARAGSQIDFGHARELPLLTLVHGLARQSVHHIRSGLYLREHEVAALARHDVDFANAAAKVGLKHSEALCFEIFYGAPFTPSSYAQITLLRRLYITGLPCRRRQDYITIYLFYCQCIIKNFSIFLIF
jgi:hypothetical protein